MKISLHDKKLIKTLRHRLMTSVLIWSETPSDFNACIERLREQGECGRLWFIIMNPYYIKAENAASKAEENITGLYSLLKSQCLNAQSSKLDEKYGNWSDECSLFNFALKQLIKNNKAKSPETRIKKFNVYVDINFDSNRTSYDYTITFSDDFELTFHSLDKNTLARVKITFDKKMAELSENIMNAPSVKGV